jgi:hypothetical protein
MVDHFAKNHAKDSVLLPEEWAAIEIVKEWLQMFQLATTRLSSLDTSTISSVFAVFLGLQSHVRTQLANAPVDLPPELTAGLIGAHKKLAEYFTKSDACPYYMWSACEYFDLCFLSAPNFDFHLVLDPRIRLSGALQVVAHDQRLQQDVLASKVKFDDHFRLHYAAHHMPSNNSHPLVLNDLFFSIFATQQPKVPAPTQELDAFFSLPPESFDGRSRSMVA